MNAVFYIADKFSSLFKPGQAQLRRRPHPAVRHGGSFEIEPSFDAGMF
jgi:hypothetical protein